jgi:hypothetical protein
MRHPNQRNVVSFMIVNGKKGDTFYTHKKNKDVTAIASYYDREVTTTRVINLEGNFNKPIVKTLTKVIIKK